MKNLILLFAIGFLLVSFSFLSAQSPGWTPRNGWNNYISRLNLTPEQIKKFENLFQDFIKEINPMENDLMSKSRELRSLFFKSIPDNMAIVTKEREISVLQLKLQKKIFDYRLDALGILTTEQILLLPSDCGLGFNLGRGFGLGYGRGFGRGFGRGRGMGFYNGYGRRRGRNGGWCPYWWR